MNQVDKIVHDWGWWNRVYTRFLIRTRGYQLTTMSAVLPAVQTAEELTGHENGALLWLKPRESFHNLPPPKVMLGEHADYTFDYYKREFAPRMDRPFVAYFRNPVLYGRHFSILDSKKHAFEDCFIRDRRWRNAVPRRGRLPTPKKISGTYLLAGSEFHNHYAHLFCDVLPRLELFEEAGVAGRFPHILPPRSHAFADDAIQLLGLEGKDSLRWDDGCWQVDGLYFASSFKKFCSWTPESALWIRRRFNPSLEQKSPGKKRFYISRRNGMRPALNETEILAALQPWGITMVEPDRLSLKEQIELFSEAELILGPHGAGIQNALWAPRGCAVLEFISPRYFSGIYWTLAESLDQPYGFITGTTDPQEDPNKIGSTYDPRLIIQALEVLLPS